MVILAAIHVMDSDIGIMSLALFIEFRVYLDLFPALLSVVALAANDHETDQCQGRDANEYGILLHVDAVSNRILFVFAGVV